MKRLVSIITVTYNSKHYLEQFLPSLTKTIGDYQIIISDNNSNDGSVEYILTAFPQVTLIQNRVNQGFAMGNNLAAAQSMADILVFINPDTTIEPEWLEYLTNPFDDPKVGLTTSKILLMHDKNKINTCGNAMHISGITQCRGVDEPSSHFTMQEQVAAVSGATFAIRRELFEQLNGFDADFFMYLEETDLSLRARAMGWKCIYVPDSITYHDYKLNFSAKKVFYQEKNRYLLLLKTLKWSTLILMIPILFMAEIITWGFVLLKDRKNFTNKISAYAWIFRNWHTILEKRNIIQSSKIVSDFDLLSKTTDKINFNQVTRGLLQKLLTVFNIMYWAMRHCLLFILRIFNI